MNVSIKKANTEHKEAIATICANGWRQTVEGKLSEEYQLNNVDFWYKPEKVYKDISGALLIRSAPRHNSYWSNRWRNDRRQCGGDICALCG